MEFITLYNGVKMPILGFGTYKAKGDDCANAVKWALEAGYRLIDTAEMYQNEKEVAKGIKAAGVKREDLFIVTKVSFKSYENAREAVMNSLKNLETDYLDLVLLHWPIANYYKAWRELEKLYKEGVIRAIGVSNFDPDRLIDVLSFNEIKPMINQIETHLYCQRKVDHEYEDKYGVAHMGYSPLGQGKVNEVFDEPLVIELAKKYNKTVQQILIRFSIDLGVVTIPKSVHKERIEANFDVLDFKLTKEEMEKLGELDRAYPNTGRAEDPKRIEYSLTW